MRKVAEKVVLSSKTKLVEGTITSEDLELRKGGKVTVRTLHGGRQEGVAETLVDAGDITFSIIPTRGMGIWWAKYRGRPLFWQSPQREAVHPMHVNLERNNGFGWLDGFCEGIVRCGLCWHGAPGVDEITNNFGNITRAQLSLHGRIANIPASSVSIAGWRQGKRYIIEITGVVHEEGPYQEKLELVSRTQVELGGNTIYLHDEVTNLSKERTSPLEMLYHINFGPPALSRGSRMIYSGSAVPFNERSAEVFDKHTTFSGKIKGFIEECYFIDLAPRSKGETGTMLVNARGNFAVYELHNKKQLKNFTLWKQLGVDEYVVGFEPGTSLVNNRSIERKAGRLEFIAPGETRKFDVVVGALEETSTIKSMAKRLG